MEILAAVGDHITLFPSKMYSTWNVSWTNGKSQMSKSNLFISLVFSHFPPTEMQRSGYRTNFCGSRNSGDEWITAHQKFVPANVAISFKNRRHPHPSTIINIVWCWLQVLRILSFFSSERTTFNSARLFGTAVPFPSVLVPLALWHTFFEIILSLFIRYVPRMSRTHK